MQIAGSIAVVTGAASGLGRAAVEMLVREGARVAAIDLSPAASMPAQEAVLPLQADVADATALEAAFARVQAHWGIPTILVNCAGVLGPARVFRVDKVSGQIQPQALDKFRRVLEINLVGTFNAIRLFAAGLSVSPVAPAEDAVDRGVVVNTASVAAYEGLSGQAAYSASKAGVASMTLPLARELARYGIRVLALAPGTFETGMVSDIPEHTRRTLVADVPFPPRAGRPVEFAHMVRALIENQMMNGTVVRIDGAVRMREPQPTQGPSA